MVVTPELILYDSGTEVTARVISTTCLTCRIDNLLSNSIVGFFNCVVGSSLGDNGPVALIRLFRNLQPKIYKSGFRVGCLFADSKDGIHLSFGWGEPMASLDIVFAEYMNPVKNPIVISICRALTSEVFNRDRQLLVTLAINSVAKPVERPRERSLT